MVLDWRVLKGVTLLWFIAYVAALIASHEGWLLWTGGLVESVCWLFILSLLASLRPLHAFIVGLSSAHRRFVAGAVLLLMWGQFMGMRPERAFPIVCWRMFGTNIRKVEPLTFVEVVGDTFDGRQVKLNPSHLFPALNNHRITVGLTRLADAGPGQRQQLGEVLTGIGRVHNATNPTTPVQSVGLIRGRVDPDVTVPSAKVTRERLWTVKLDARTTAP